MDEEFAEDSLRIFEAAKFGQVVILVSAIVTGEVQAAPPDVRYVLEELPKSATEDVPITDEVNDLRDAYLSAGILGPRWLDDAAHVAAATVARADAIVSWNFQHIVRLDKMKAYNQVNLANGYGVLIIVSPKEVQINGSRED